MEIDVIYLIRFNDFDYSKRLNNFLCSYNSNNAGIKHNLIIIFKGFSVQKLNTTKRFIKNKFNIVFKTVIHDDVNYDIGSYILAARDSNAEALFFLNSSSRILCDNWLKLFYLTYKPSIGLIGATGSAEKLDHFWFQSWPNYHIRTNAFFIRKDLFSKLTEGMGRFTSKNSVWKFESGRNSLTKRINKLNLDIVVLGKDGLFYPPKLWIFSNTFKIADQGNLIIADKQTDYYDKASIDIKNQLTYRAWRLHNKSDIYNHFSS